MENLGLVEIKRSDGHLPPLLFDVIRIPSKHGLEKHIINQLPFKEEGHIDEKGNLIIKIGAKPSRMFSCHMDTVHQLDVDDCLKRGVKPTIQLFTKDPEKVNVKETGFLTAAYKKWNGDKKTFTFEKSVLGADDKAGIYVMSKMIEAKIPGLYVFHVGEECGGIGSSFISTKTPDLVKDIQQCVAFDRKDYVDVIDTQSAGRCASSEYSAALVEQLNTNIDLPDISHKFHNRSRGTFTDSANYRELIPECVNLSVGYFDQHTPNEKLDVWWLTTKFIPAVLKIDWDKLPIKRDPKHKDVSTSYYYAGVGNDWDKDRFDQTWKNKYNPIKYQWKDITGTTPQGNLPSWTIKDGYVIDGSYDANVNVVYNSFLGNHNAFPLKRAARVIVDLLLEKRLEDLDTDNAMDEADRKDLLESIRTVAKSENTNNIINLPATTIVRGGKSEVFKAVSSNKTDTAITVDYQEINKDGLPKHRNIFDSQLKVKRDIINTIVSHCCVWPKNRELDFRRIKTQFSKINKNMARNPKGMSKKVYVKFNKMMVELVMMLNGFNIDKQDDVCTQWIGLAHKYISDNQQEEGMQKVA